MSEKRKVTMDDALAAGDGVILNVQAARIEELEDQNKDLLEALQKVVSLVDAGQGTWTLDNVIGEAMISFSCTPANPFIT